jgi:hypothetical protein
VYQGPNVERTDDRPLCPGSDLELSSDLVNEWTSRGPCPACGQEVSIRLVEQSWFLEWHLERLESGPDIEVPPQLR